MRFVKPVAIALVAYVALVAAFESYLGIAQPQFQGEQADGWNATIVLTTKDADGSAQKRVVSPMVTDGQLYVSANHWPRSWYNRVLANPELQVTNRDETKDYVAVPIPPGSEVHERLEREHPHPAWFRFLTGYPPRRFVRLEPRPEP